MKRKRHVASPSLPELGHQVGGGKVPRYAPVVALVALGLAAYGRALTTYFAQDDFTWLLRASQAAPVGVFTPRFLSLHAYMRLVWNLVGPNAPAFHALGLALHLFTSWLFYDLLRKRLPWPLALGAAGLFVTSPAVFDALHWVSAVSDLLCGAALALAVTFLLRGGKTGSRWLPWAAVGAFFAAVACKENAVGAAPVLAALEFRRGGRGALVRAASYLAIAPAAAIVALHSVATGLGQAYAMNPVAVIANAPGYAASALLAGTAAHSISDVHWARSSLVMAAGGLLVLVWILGLLRARSKPAWLGFAWFWALLLPVVALERQFYLYYSYCALPGLLASVAFIVATHWGRRNTWPAAVSVAVILCQLWAVHVRAGARLLGAPLPRDFVLRRAEVARQALDDLRAQRGAVGPNLVLVSSQPIQSSAGGVLTTRSTGYSVDPIWDVNLQAALANGDAVRLLIPGVRTVRFEDRVSEADSEAAIGSYDVEGHIRVAGYIRYAEGSGDRGVVPLEIHLKRADALIQGRAYQPALRELELAEKMAPDNVDVLVDLGFVNMSMGNPVEAERALLHALHVAPANPEALYNLGTLYSDAHRLAEARSVWRQLSRVAPNTELGRDARRLLQHTDVRSSGRSP